VLNLSPRLKMVADMVRRDVIVADIGTDHGYLPAYLMLSKKVSGAIAADLRKKPLESARETLVSYGLVESVPLVLSNGLENIKKDSADDIVIAGMGGTLIVEILKNCDWICNANKRLIIQPMSRAEEVRQFFMQNGFEILAENATIDSDRLYIAINAVYSGKSYSNLPISYAYIGKLCECQNTYAKEYLQNQIARLKKRADALYKINNDDCKAQELYTIISDIERCVKDDNSKKCV
jgi:tRNA (adenine22-N1)-methyltransferase